MKPFCLIPARLGSKRLPRKNVIDFRGKPLIAHAIECALASGVFSRVAVSTEAEEVAEIARRYGAEVPYLRDASLATDTATVVQVTLDFMTWLDERGEMPPVGAVMLTTSPLRTSDDVRQAWERFGSTGAEFLMTVCEVPYSPFQLLGPDGEWLKPAFGAENTHRDWYKETKYYYDLGALYLFDVARFREVETFYGPRLTGHVLPPERAIDIDNPFSLELAELMARAAEDPRGGR